MRERLSHISVVMGAVVTETARRQDLYVVWILAVFGLAAGSVLARAGVRGIETFLRDIALTVVNFLSVAICVWLAARQVPEELSRRTLFPLLARPVRRTDVLAGKLLAVWLLSSGALVVLAGTAWACLRLFAADIGPIFWQYLLLRAFSFGPIAALTMAISLVLSPAATVVLSGLLTLCWTTFARTLADAVQQSDGVLQGLLKLAYFVLPHLDLFDLSQRAAYNYPPVPAWAVGALLLYAGAYSAVFLALGGLRFRRMAI